MTVQQKILIILLSFLLYQQMFQNSYQNGTYFQVFDAKATQDKLKLLYRTTNIGANCKVFDKDLKTFVFQTLTPNAQLYLPKEQKKDLYLIQQYLTFQIFFFQGLSWSIELVVSDLTKTKRRIILSPATTKTQIKPFFVKTPCNGWEEGVWNNFVVDLYSFMEAFKGQTYRSLDAIHLTGHFKLRRIYTSSSEPMEMQGQQQPESKPINFLPKTFCFPMGVPFVTKVSRYDGDIVTQVASEITEHSTKNSSFLKTSKTRQVIKPGLPLKPQQVKREVIVEDIKTEKTITKNQSMDRVKVQNKKKKDFLSNTNGEMVAKMKDKGRLSLQKNASSQKIIDVKPKTQTKAKSKLNPWRNSQKQQLTDASQMQISKFQSNRKAVTPETFTVFNKKQDNITEFNDTKNNRFDGKSEQYSDTQYVQLSQKFSTFTEGKFLRSDFPQSKMQQLKLQNEDEIEENIEMQSNSLYSHSNKKEDNREGYNVEIEHIKESICDSLDRLDEKKRSREMEELGRSSLYGFGEKLMRNFMHEIERPYSPPMGEREGTEEEETHRVMVEKDEVEVIYDPVLNCYYDHKTHTYYELKN